MTELSTYAGINGIRLNAQVVIRAKSIRWLNTMFSCALESIPRPIAVTVAQLPVNRLCTHADIAMRRVLCIFGVTSGRILFKRVFTFTAFMLCEL